MSGKLDLELEVVVEDWRHAMSDVDAIVRNAVCFAWAAAGSEHDAELNLILHDDRAVRRLNREHRGLDRSTNVLSFPMGEPMDPDGPVHLGDIILAFETGTKEAIRDQKSLEAHLSHLVVHGLLHLLGHDHAAEAEASEMEGTEISILSELGYPDPYVALPEAAE